jgi:hypothetical protein
VDGNQGIGISLAEAGSSLTLTDCAIRNTTSNNMGTAGWGVSIQNGSTATVSDCAVNMNTVTGLRASGLNSSITASRVSVRDTRVGTVNDWGRGAVAQSGAKLTFDHVAISGSAETGIVLAVGATGLLTDLTVSNTMTNSAGLFGRAINVADQSRLTLTRATLSRNKDASLMVVGQGAFADVRNSVIYSTTRAKDDVARGITVQESAGLALSGSAVVGSVECGVVVVDDGTWAGIGRSAIFDTAADSKGGFGHGLVTGLSNVNVRACQIGGSAGIGLAVGPGSVLADELTLTANGTGVYVDQSVTLSVVDQVPGNAGTDQLFLSTSSRFIGNAENSGSGALALPSGLFR